LSAPSGQPRWAWGPVRPAPLRGRSPVAMAHPRSATPHPLPRSRAAEATTDLAGRVDRVVPVGQVAPDPVDRVTTDPAGPVDRVTTDPAGSVDRVTTDPAGPVDRVTTDRVDRVAPDSTVQEGPAVPAAHGTAMTTAATSTTLRGGTDPHPGVRASHRDRHGTGRFRRPVDRGTTGRSTTGATRKRLSGTRSSTSSASTSSEFGSRCKDSPHQTPASPIGGAGVAHLPVVAPIRPITVCQQHGAPWATIRESPKSRQNVRYSGEMATLRSMQSGRALTVGLVSAGVLAGAMLVGPAGTASASRHFDFPAFEEPAPPSPPGPMPEIEGPANQGPANQAPRVRHRRPLDDPSVHK
jgi:hypothetical protein